jgi:hypothetical protein
VINPSQRPLPENTQHSQQTKIHALGGIRTPSLSRRASEDLRLRRRGHWDRPNQPVGTDISEEPTNPNSAWKIHMGFQLCNLSCAVPEIALDCRHYILHIQEVRCYNYRLLSLKPLRHNAAVHTILSSSQTEGKICSSFQKRADLLWSAPSILFSWYREIFRRG